MDNFQDKVIALGFGSFIVGLLIGSLFSAFYLIISWRLATKAGYASWKAFLMLIPLVNFFVLLAFTFGRWPIENRLAELESKKI